MKQASTTLLIVILSLGRVNGQHSYYISSGYGVGGSKQLVSVQSDELSSAWYGGTPPRKLEGVYGTFGTGFKFLLSYGYSFSDNLEMTIDYNWNRSANLKTTSSELDYNYNPVKTRFYYESMYAKYWQVSPNVKVNFKVMPESKINFFLKLGPVLSSTVLYSENTVSEELVFRIDYKEKFARKFSLGGQAYIGVEYPIRANLWATFSAGFTIINFSTDKSEYTSFKLGGRDQLASLSVIDKETVSKNTISVNASPIDSTKPREELRTSYSLSSIPLSLGIRKQLK